MSSPSRIGLAAVATATFALATIGLCPTLSKEPRSSLEVDPLHGAASRQGSRNVAQSTRSVIVVQTSTAVRIHRVGATEEFKKLKRKLSKDDHDPKRDEAGSPSGPVGAPACRPNVDVVAEVRPGDVCHFLGPGHPKSWKVWIHNKSSMPASVEYEWSDEPSKSHQRNHFYLMHPGARADVASCGTSARISSCKFLGKPQ